MNNDERQMIADLFERMRTVQNLDKDSDAEAFIHQSMRENANSPYLLVQSVLAQEVALQEAGKRIEAATVKALGDPANHTGDLRGKATTKTITDAIVAHLND